MTIFQGFLRPIEITAANKTVAVSGGASGTVNLTEKVYPCILVLLKDLETALVAINANFSVYLTSDWNVVIANSSVSFVLTWTDEQLGRMLGFRDDVASTATATATDTPQYCFLPKRHSWDNNRFQVPSKSTFSGGVAIGGQLAGISLDAEAIRDFKYDALSAPDVYKEAGLLSYDWSAVTYYPDTERCFMEFQKLARNTVLSESGSGNVSPKGCYYLDRAQDWTGASPTNDLPSSMTAGGIKFDLNTVASRDTYVYCNISTPAPNPTALHKNSAAYYKIEFTLTTVSSVDWV